jgi:hypothetical protein
MVRTTVRGILVGGIAAAALVAAAAPAAAKCGHGSGDPCPHPVSLEAVVYDPTWRPLIIGDEDAWRMLNVTGVNYGPYNVFDVPPDRLGPKYQVTYRFTQGDRIWAVQQDLYPYATGRPFAFTPAGQRIANRYGEGTTEVNEGWRGSRTLETILRAHGLPGAPPVRTDASIQGAATSRGDGSGGGPFSGGLIVGTLAFLSLAGLAARWSFRRRSSGVPA